MRIGLDFDNTLACYDAVFSAEAKKHGVVPNEWNGSKQELKNRVTSFQDGNILWQQIQGQVYGPSMYKASMFPGVARFLIRCRLHGYTVIIVSHKTKYGHFDSTKTSLREAALSWMNEQGFFNRNKFGILKENIFFESTRQEKVARINTLNLDVFIDDLEEVFAEDGFPEIKKILFSRASESSYCNIIYSNWFAITEDIFGKTTDSEIKHFLQSMCYDEVRDVQQTQGGGNSRLYKIQIDNGFFALKDYPDLLGDSRTRLHTEVQAVTILEKFHKTEKSVIAATIELLKPYKDHVLTITADNGKEFAGHERVAKALKCDYYFAHPYSSWERGLNENANGLIRQFFPKGNSFEGITICEESKRNVKQKIQKDSWIRYTNQGLFWKKGWSENCTSELNPRLKKIKQIH